MASPAQPTAESFCLPDQQQLLKPLHRVGLCRILLVAAICCQAPATRGQDAGLADTDLPERIEMQFGVHTSESGQQSWNVAVKLIKRDGHEHISLSDAERAIEKLAADHIQRLQHTHCLTSQQIAKLKLAARLRAHHFVRQGEAFRNSVANVPITNQSNPRFEAKVWNFKQQHAGQLFEPQSTFAQLWNAISSSD